MSLTTKNHSHSDAASDGTSAELESLKEAFSHLRKDVMQVLEGAVGVGKSGASDVIDNAKSRLHDLRESGGSRVNEIGKRIEESPFAATAIALGVGFLIAKLFRHRR